jgi:hypothetical protein
VQQAHLEALLELTHGMAERGRRDAEPQCGCPKAQMICDSDERGQIGEVTAMGHS